MMPASVEDQLRSAESALSFLRAEHSRTLAGLHEEIERLQTRCKELTFSLTLQSSQSQSMTKEHDSTPMGMKRAHRKHAQLFNPDSVLSHPALAMTARDSSYVSMATPDSARSAVGQEREQLQSLIEEKEKKIYYLERELRLREDSYLAELARKNRQVALLTRRLHTRPAAIVQISSRAVRKSKTSKNSDDTDFNEDEGASEEEAVNGGGLESQRKTSQTKLPSLSKSLPSFPPQDRTLSAVARRGKGGSANVHAGGKHNGKPPVAAKLDGDHGSRQSSAKTTRSQRVSASSSASRKASHQTLDKVPESSPFIVDIPTELFLQIRPAPAILPPIAGRGRRTFQMRHGRATRVSKHHNMETERPRKPPPPAVESIAVETVAVETVASPGAEVSPVEQSRADCS